ncbi:MAG: hypothetical protein ACFFD1_00465, partial [Candidatus Thorarchaeota archaeon]
MSEIFCKYCGKSNDNLNKFCFNCGNELDVINSKKNSDLPKFIENMKTKFIITSKPKIDKMRSSVLQGIDKLIADVNDPRQLRVGSKELSPKYREKLARSLAILKEKISDNSGKNVFNEKESITNLEAEEIIEEELLQQLKNDRCIICYGNFNQEMTNGSKILVCPNCGQGGHIDHLETYIKTNQGKCPVCRQTSKLEKY